MGSKLLIASDWEGRQVTKGQFETDRTIFNCVGRYTNMHVKNSMEPNLHTCTHTSANKLGKSEKVDYINQCWL